VKLATAVKAGIRALLAKHNIRLSATDLTGDTATGILDALALPGTYATRLASQRRLMLVLADEIAATEVELHRRLRHHPGARNLLTVKGIGPVLAAAFVAEIGDVARFPTAGALCCWAGLTPRHYESDKTSAKKETRLCAGRRLRRSSDRPNPRSKPSASGSSPAAARTPATSRRSPRPGGCSRPSTTCCATAGPAASPPRTRHEHHQDFLQAG
jgi:transposase